MTESNATSPSPEMPVEKKTGLYYINAFLLAVLCTAFLVWMHGKFLGAEREEISEEVLEENLVQSIEQGEISMLANADYLTTMLLNAAYTGIPTIACCLYLLYVKKKKKLSAVLYFSPVESVPYKKNFWTFLRRFGAMFGSAIGLSYVVSALCARIGVKEDTQSIVSLISEATDRNWQFYAVTFITACVTAPICEEILFRVVVTRTFAYRLPIAHAICISAMFFGMLHGSLTAFLPLFAVGCFLQKTCDEYGLWGAMIQHGMLNGLELILLFSFENLG